MNINKNTTQCVVLSEDVITKIVSVAALDVDGVCDMASAGDIRKLFKSGTLGSVRVNKVDGAFAIDVYIKLKVGAKIASVCEKVQQSVKKAVQNMTGLPVTQVNVHVVDIDIEEELAAM